MSDVIALLAREWDAIAGLLDDLEPADWSRPVLPGWDVHDVVAHIVGTERALAGAELPALPPGEPVPGHVRNDIGTMNEAWVVALRPLPDADLLAQFRAVTEQRLMALRAMTAQEFDAPSWSPAGPATYARFMGTRVFDCWMHEQDIREATRKPGNESGPVAERALDEAAGGLGYAIGKLGKAPQGSTVRITLTGPINRDLHVVVDGRARVTEAVDGEPTVTMTMPSSLFFRLCGGRDDAASMLGQIEFGGDVELGRRLAANLGFLI